jgi:hypothetical protein
MLSLQCVISVEMINELGCIILSAQSLSNPGCTLTLGDASFNWPQEWYQVWQNDSRPEGSDKVCERPTPGLVCSGTICRSLPGRTPHFFLVGPA